MTATRLKQTLLHLTVAAVAAAGVGLVGVPPQAPRTCGSGTFPNPYWPECLSPISTPTISGVPCVASKIALCSSLVQNQQPMRSARPLA